MSDDYCAEYRNGSPYGDPFLSGMKEYRIMTSGVGLLEFVKEPYLVERIIVERIRRERRYRGVLPDTLRPSLGARSARRRARAGVEKG